MCLLFFETKEDPAPDEYQLVLANVRDEYYSRRTAVADFWEEEPSVIGGRDLHPRREGGTWLALNKQNRKIGVLLNILQPDHELVADRKGRGFIVNDYVFGEESHSSYLNALAATSSSYNGFLMIAMEIHNRRVSTSYYSNHFEFEQPPQQLDDGIHGFGNSLNPFSPWPKVSHGKKRFESLLTGHRTTETKAQLVQDLFGMLSDKTIFPLDRQMMKQGDGSKLESLKKLNSVFVQIPERKYGSRTWTIILVDGEGRVDYIENTLREPIQSTSDGVIHDWQLSSHNFLLH